MQLGDTPLSPSSKIKREKTFPGGLILILCSHLPSLCSLLCTGDTESEGFLWLYFLGRGALSFPKNGPAPDEAIRMTFQDECRGQGQRTRLRVEGVTVG